MAWTDLLRTRFVSETEFWRHFSRLGALYFIRNDAEDCIKIGYSRQPWSRLSNLQVGSPTPLRMIGLIAASEQVEPIVHEWHRIEYHRQGEWFWDGGSLTPWLMEMTHNEPMCRNVWEIVPGQEFWYSWDKITQTHIKHLRNKVTGEWEPPIK